MNRADVPAAHHDSDAALPKSTSEDQVLLPAITPPLLALLGNDYVRSGRHAVQFAENIDAVVDQKTLDNQAGAGVARRAQVVRAPRDPIRTVAALADQILRRNVLIRAKAAQHLKPLIDFRRGTSD